MVEVPLKVRGVREHGKSRVASNLWKYATNSLPIILRAMRDIQPMKFFGGISVLLGILGFLTGGFVRRWYAIGDHVKMPSSTAKRVCMSCIAPIRSPA